MDADHVAYARPSHQAKMSRLPEVMDKHNKPLECHGLRPRALITVYRIIVYNIIIYIYIWIKTWLTCSGSLCLAAWSLSAVTQAMIFVYYREVSTIYIWIVNSTPISLHCQLWQGFPRTETSAQSSLSNLIRRVIIVWCFSSREVRLVYISLTLFICILYLLALSCLLFFGRLILVHSYLPYPILLPPSLHDCNGQSL